MLAMIRRSHRRVAVIALTLPTLWGCNELLEVKAPTQILATTLDDPQKASLLLNSMIATFNCALGAYIVVSGELADLFTFVGGNAIRDKYDSRRMSSGLGYTSGYNGTVSCEGSFPADGSAIGSYANLQESRWLADHIANKLEGWTDAHVTTGNRVQMLGRAQAYQGYGELLLGEGFCTMAFNSGPELTRLQVFQAAEATFTKAIQNAQTAGDAQTRTFATLGRARARLNAGKGAEAAADAALVPAGFVERTEQSATDLFRQNQVFRQSWSVAFSSVEIFWRNYVHQGVAEPRIALVQRLSPREVWAPQKHPAATTGIPIARHVEAQLILAEVQGGQNAVNIINQLHTAAGIPAFSSTDATEIKNHVIEERSIELFAEGHRLGDLLRYNIPFRPPAGSPAPRSDPTYGTDTCMPLPIQEVQNNPNITR